MEVDDVGSDMGTGGLWSSSGNKFRLDEVEECLDASGVVRVSCWLGVGHDWCRGTGRGTGDNVLLSLDITSL